MNLKSIVHETPSWFYRFHPKQENREKEKRRRKKEREGGGEGRGEVGEVIREKKTRNKIIGRRHK